MEVNPSDAESNSIFPVQLCWYFDNTSVLSRLYEFTCKIGFEIYFLYIIISPLKDFFYSVRVVRSCIPIKNMNIDLAEIKNGNLKK